MGTHIKRTGTGALAALVGVGIVLGTGNYQVGMLVAGFGVLSALGAYLHQRCSKNPLPERRSNCSYEGRTPENLRTRHNLGEIPGHRVIYPTTRNSR